MPQQSRLSTLLNELKRRRVFRVAAVYGGVAFVLTEIVGNTFSYLGIQDWFGTAIIVLLIAGFPVAVGLAWVFDITPEGIVRTKSTLRQDQGDGAKVRLESHNLDYEVSIISRVELKFGHKLVWHKF